MPPATPDCQPTSGVFPSCLKTTRLQKACAIGYGRDPNFGGGFMLKAYQQPEAIGLTIDRAQCQYEAYKRHGRYPLARP